MSNTEASKLYEAVIEEVISDSRQDFENSGIDETTLQELKRIWREKLSAAAVARFAWDDEVAQQQQHHQASGLVPDLSAALGPGDVGLSLTGGLELPTDHLQTTIQQTQLPEYDESNGLILPRVNQADGTFEMTVETGSDFIDKLRQKHKSQVDGTLDEEDDDDLLRDSDDINSDLDDGLESEKSDDEDGDQEGQIMLCLYDKVQRVKNKWKSNLKEGIANIDGKDYVFHKATGECEW